MQSLFFARMSDRFSLHETNHCSGSGQCGDVDLAMNSQKPSICAEVQVMFFDTDSGGVVSNIAYLRFIEIARTALAEELGLRLSEGGGTGQRRCHRKDGTSRHGGAPIGLSFVC